MLRRYEEVYVGVLYKTEIDFIAVNRNEKIYIHVCDNASNFETLRREIKPLLQIKDGFKKIVHANTKQNTYCIDGIDIIDISKWLSNT